MLDRSPEGLRWGRDEWKNDRQRYLPWGQCKKSQSRELDFLGMPFLRRDRSVAAAYSVNQARLM